MPKFTYPIVFLQSDDNTTWTAFIPDLVIFAQGNTTEDAYSEAEDMLCKFISLSVKYEQDFPAPSTLEQINEKWGNYKTSLITASV